MFVKIAFSITFEHYVHWCENAEFFHSEITLWKDKNQEECMVTFLSNNAGTILTGLVLLGIVTAIILKMRRDKKKNKCAGCSCGCAVSDITKS